MSPGARGRVSDLPPEPEPETHYCNNPGTPREKSSLNSPRMEERRKWISDKITSANTEKYLHYGAQETYNRNPGHTSCNIRLMLELEEASCVPVLCILAERILFSLSENSRHIQSQDKGKRIIYVHKFIFHK